MQAIVEPLFAEERVAGPWCRRRSKHATSDECGRSLPWLCMSGRCVPTSNPYVNEGLHEKRVSRGTGDCTGWEGVFTGRAVSRETGRVATPAFHVERDVVAPASSRRVEVCLVYRSKGVIVLAGAYRSVKRSSAREHIQAESWSAADRLTSGWARPSAVSRTPEQPRMDADLADTCA